jgi:peptide/nickel transport system ATP-binding protein
MEEAPPLVPARDPSHRFRCWFPVGTPEGADALARNLADGVSVGLPGAPDARATSNDQTGEES